MTTVDQQLSALLRKINKAQETVGKAATECDNANTNIGDLNNSTIETLTRDICYAGDKCDTAKDYCDDVTGTLSGHGIVPIELGSYLQGQCLAFHPAYAAGFSAFHPEGLSGEAVTQWAADQLRKSIDASVNLGTTNISVMSGGFAWHMIYPWPQRPAGLIDEAFAELARRWQPLLDYATGPQMAALYLDPDYAVPSQTLVSGMPAFSPERLLWERQYWVGIASFLLHGLDPFIAS